MPELVVPTVRLHAAWLEGHDEWGHLQFIEHEVEVAHQRLAQFDYRSQ